MIVTSGDASNDFEFWHRFYHFFGYSKPRKNSLNFIVVPGWIRKINVIMDQLKVFLQLVEPNLPKLLINLIKNTTEPVKYHMVHGERHTKLKVS